MHYSRSGSLVPARDRQQRRRPLRRADGLVLHGELLLGPLLRADVGFRRYWLKRCWLKKA